MKTKYGIMEEDIYNFDETGFMMGIIFNGIVVTTSDSRGRAELASSLAELLDPADLYIIHLSAVWQTYQ